MANIKELSALPQRLNPGHRLCAGCGASIAVRQVLMGAGEDDVVIGNATGCLEVSTTVYPYLSWNAPYVHNAFANAGATMSGVEAAFKGMKATGKIPEDKEIKFITFGGDGGTYDIGLQSLSGAMERGHNMLYVCYDNNAYMNTGIQRSSATPKGAWTTTAETGSVLNGKKEKRKDLTSIMAEHHIPYVAQASIGDWKDLVNKAEKAIHVDGPAFLCVLSPCPRGWRIQSNQTIEIARLAINSKFWPLFEVDHGKWTMKEVPEKKVVPVEDYMRPQGRFSHLFKPEPKTELIAEIQQDVDEYYDYIKSRCDACKD